jgi:hypothetical protein
MKYVFSLLVLLIISFLQIKGQNLSIGAGYGGFSSYVKISNYGYISSIGGLLSSELQSYKTLSSTPCINILFEPWVNDSISLRTGIIIHQLRYEYEITQGDHVPGTNYSVIRTYEEEYNSIDVNIPILLSFKKSWESGTFRFEAGPYLRRSIVTEYTHWINNLDDFKPYSGGFCISVSGGSKKVQVGVISLINFSNNLEGTLWFPSGGSCAGNYVIELSILGEFPLKVRRD